MNSTFSLKAATRLALGAGLSLAMSAAGAQAPTAADLMNNAAFIKLDKVHTSMGAFASPMHFISPLVVNGQIWAYYIKRDGSNTPYGAVGLAKSNDGFNFVEAGTVLTPGAAGTPDSVSASFPGVWYDNGKYYLVYEAEGSAGYTGNIGLATSTDGVNFTKEGIILWHNQSGWESTNIGTPGLYKEGATWYLHYHGYNGSVVQIGVASGTDLHNLTKSAANPVIKTVPATWQAGTAGRRDIVKAADGKYYMVYEGSEAAPFNTTKWSSGMASSADMINWSTFSQNAVLPQTAGGFGNDGPAFLNFGGLNYIYYRTGATRRALIANETVGGFDVSWGMADAGIGHVVGRAEADGAWSVNVAQDRQNYMQFGPYYPSLPSGDHIATWRMAIDNNTFDNLAMVRLEVVDVDAGGEVVAQRSVTRRQWKTSGQYEYFSVPFNWTPARLNHRLEMRVLWNGTSYLKLKRVGIS